MIWADEKSLRNIMAEETQTKTQFGTHIIRKMLQTVIQEKMQNG